MPNHILVLTNDVNEVKLLKTALSHSRQLFTIEWLTLLSSGIKRLRNSDIDAVIVNLSLPDSSGLATFEKLWEAVPYIPIVVLSPADKTILAGKLSAIADWKRFPTLHLQRRKITQSLVNIIARKHMEEASHEEKQRAEIILNSILDAVICTDLSGRIVYLNPSAVRMTGWSTTEAHGRYVGEVFRIVDSTTHEPPSKHPIYTVLQQNTALEISADTLLIKKNGEEMPIEDSMSPLRNQRGELGGVVIVFHNMTAAREMAKKMEHLAQHDFLTNLPNRLLLDDRIAQAITLARRTGSRFAVLFMDLDHFKHINDALGHEAGDQLLQSVALRLTDCVRHSDTVSRQGGDEFIILLSSSQLDLDAALTADKILKALNQPHHIANHALQVTASIGISLYPDDGTDAQTLIKNADTAMYGAKESGSNNYKFFRNEMNVRAKHRQFLESGLHTALEQQRFELHYQPRVNLDNGTVTAAEALLRWRHQEWGLLDAVEFISTAEECGLMIPIGKWVLHEACQQAKRWMDAGLQPVPVAINVSSLEFHQDNFIAGISKALQETGLEAQYLQLEINETVLKRESSATAAMLKQLRNMHIKIILDDFGTGSASLAYLQQFTFDVLKIDQSFIQDIHSVDDEAIMVNAIIGMAQKLHMGVVAEGVENRTQHDFLKCSTCIEAQGYYFSAPQKGDRFPSMVTGTQHWQI